jgi:SNF family Na+-dependent transporter
MKRQEWTSKLGVILAVAGSAVGLGNFLRFPSIATQNGGGAFLIPYFIALILLGIPMCWVEWAMGRYGGQFSHGSAPGILDAIGGRRRPEAKYLGAIGIFGPLLIFFYYVVIESWTLGYAFYSLTGVLVTASQKQQVMLFFDGYRGVAPNDIFPTITPMYIIFLITFVINFGILYLGISKGIELVNKVAMPLLAIIGLVLTARVLTLGTPDPAHPDWNVLNGLGFMWNPDFKRLGEPRVWLVAAGQIFFTLSVGIGVILTYASYLKPKDDVALSSLSASAANEFMEVIIAGSVVIPAAVVFYGATQAVDIAKGGSFNLGFVTMPLIFARMPGGSFFCFLWFILLFLAGLTSSISILQPAVSFLEDEFRYNRRRSILFSGLVCFIFSQFAIFGLARGFLDEMDFWGGTILLVLFGLVEVIYFGWIFGIDRGWEELHKGADIPIPHFFRLIIKYITPLYISILLIYFLVDNFRGFVLMKSYGERWKEVLMLRLALLLFFLFVCFLVSIAWKRRFNERGGKT